MSSIKLFKEIKLIWLNLNKELRPYSLRWRMRETSARASRNMKRRPPSHKESWSLVRKHFISTRTCKAINYFCCFCKSSGGSIEYWSNSSSAPRHLQPTCSIMKSCRCSKASLIPVCSLLLQHQNLDWRRQHRYRVKLLIRQRRNLLIKTSARLQVRRAKGSELMS